MFLICLSNAIKSKDDLSGAHLGAVETVGDVGATFASTGTNHQPDDAIRLSGTKSLLNFSLLCAFALITIYPASQSLLIGQLASIPICQFSGLFG